MELSVSIFIHQNVIHHSISVFTLFSTTFSPILMLEVFLNVIWIYKTFPLVTWAFFLHAIYFPPFSVSTVSHFFPHLLLKHFLFIAYHVVIIQREYFLITKLFPIFLIRSYTFSFFYFLFILHSFNVFLFLFPSSLLYDLIVLVIKIE